MGAPRSRVVRQLLTESLLISFAGGALGLVLAFGGVRALVSLLPADFPRAHDIHVSGPVLAFTLLVSLLTESCLDWRRHAKRPCSFPVAIVRATPDPQTAGGHRNSHLVTYGHQCPKSTEDVFPFQADDAFQVFGEPLVSVRYDR